MNGKTNDLHIETYDEHYFLITILYFVSLNKVIKQKQQVGYHRIIFGIKFAMIQHWLHYNNNN